MLQANRFDWKLVCENTVLIPQLQTLFSLSSVTSHSVCVCVLFCLFFSLSWSVGQYAGQLDEWKERLRGNNHDENYIFIGLIRKLRFLYCGSSDHHFDLHVFIYLKVFFLIGHTQTNSAHTHTLSFFLSKCCHTTWIPSIQVLNIQMSSWSQLMCVSIFEERKKKKHFYCDKRANKCTDQWRFSFSQHVSMTCTKISI